MKHPLFLLAAAPLALAAACSPNADTPATEASGEAAATASASATATPTASPEPTATAPGDTATLALEGFGDLVIGKPVPAGSSFAKRGAQASDQCLTYSSPDYPGTYAIVEGNTVRRFTVAGQSQIKLVEGIGVGSTEKEVLAAFPGFVSSPHKYVDAPGKYLTQPGSDPRLRFEIGENGKVTAMHVGMMPQLGYVEGCA